MQGQVGFLSLTWKVLIEKDVHMNAIDIEKTRAELMNSYPGCRVQIADDGREIVAEISHGLAVAVIESSAPHFHIKTREIHKVLRGTLHVACGGEGHVLREGETISIEPGKIHYAKSAEKLVWIEVSSMPAWTPEDHFIL